MFGATGRSGRLVVEEALARGHTVTAYVRNRERLAAASPLEVVEGSVHDAATIAGALVDVGAVISALGPIAGETTTEISTGTRTIAETMERAGPRRLVLAGNATVFTDDEVTGAFANVTAEHRRDLSILRSGSLDWTMLAPAILRDEPVTGASDATRDAPAPGRSIARTDLARVMVDAVDRADWFGHVVGVSS